MAPTGTRRRAASPRALVAVLPVVIAALAVLGAAPKRPKAGRAPAAKARATPVPARPSPSPTPPPPPVATFSNPLAGKRLYVDPDSPAQRQAKQWKKSRPQDAALMSRIASQPVAKWMGGWFQNIRDEVDEAVYTMSRSGAVPLFVVYNIPGQDCGGHSAGGARDAEAYRRWIQGFAKGLRGRSSVVILEPDALAQMECLDVARRVERATLIREAVQALKAQRAYVYIDAGNARWKKPEEMARRLLDAGIAQADGFALNVANVEATALSTSYGERLSRLVGGKHFIVDTSRNGIPGTNPENWCNPRGVALGAAPTTDTGHPLVDAYLWVKHPGQSDGPCGGGPAAGSWWAEYALELSRLASALANTGAAN